MRIIELNIVEFGCIKNKRISLSDGLNLIQGDNESGKSTVMLFIKFIFYGLGRKTAGANERERALSWSGHVASGTATVEHKGKEYLIERRAGKTARSDEVRIICLTTGEEIEGDAGDIFLGIPADAFESSCAVFQMRASDISKSGAASAIENMLVSADESIDVEKVIKRLDDVRRQYKLNRGEGGKLYETAYSIGELRQKYTQALGDHVALSENSEALERNEKKLVELEEKYKRSEKLLSELRYVELLRRFDELDAQIVELEKKNDLKEQLKKENMINGKLPTEGDAADLKNTYIAFSNAIGKYETRKAQLQALPPVSEETESLAETAKRIEAAGGADAVTAKARKQNEKARSKKTAAILSFIAAGISIAGGAAAFAILPALIALCSLGVALAIVGVAMLASRKKALLQRDALCEQYGVPFSELDAYFAKCASALNFRTQANSERIAATVRLEEAGEAMDSARGTLVALLSVRTSVSDTSCDALRALTEKEAAGIISFCRAKKELDTEIGALDISIASLKNQLSSYDRDELRASITVNVDDVTQEMISNSEREYRYNKQAYEALDKRVQELRVTVITLRTSASQSPVEISDRIRALEAKLEADTEYYEALMLAKESIEKASMAMSGNVTPELSRKAGELMSLVSQGERNKIQTTKELGLSLEYDGFLVRSEMLSGGTRDAAYLCLRIALLSRLFKDGLPPLLLDEALCQLDDSRASGVLSVLSRLSADTQCILFTCHSREARLCQELQIAHSTINI